VIKVRSGQRSPVSVLVHAGKHSYRPASRQSRPGSVHR
jgi:hypothetical protein